MSVFPITDKHWNNFRMIISPIVREVTDGHFDRFANPESYERFVESCLNEAWARAKIGGWNVQKMHAFLAEIRAYFADDRAAMFSEGFA